MAQAVKKQSSSIDWQKYALWAVYGVVGILILMWLVNATQGMKPARMIQTTITGLLVGGIYALVALGIVIINKASGVFNFAHGTMMFLGALVFFSFFTTADINLVVALVLAALVALLYIVAIKIRLNYQLPKAG